MPKLTDLVKESDYIRIDGIDFCCEEALMQYQSLSAGDQEKIDFEASVFGSHSMIEYIYRRWFPDYFQSTNAIDAVV